MCRPDEGSRPPAAVDEAFSTEPSGAARGFVFYRLHGLLRYPFSSQPRFFKTCCFFNFLQILRTHHFDAKINKWGSLSCWNWPNNSQIKKKKKDKPASWKKLHILLVMVC